MREYLPELLEDVIAGRLDPSPVPDYEVDLDAVRECHAAMDERWAVSPQLAQGPRNGHRGARVDPPPLEGPFSAPTAN